MPSATLRSFQLEFSPPRRQGLPVTLCRSLRQKAPSPLDHSTIKPPRELLYVRILMHGFFALLSVLLSAFPVRAFLPKPLLTVSHSLLLLTLLIALPSSLLSKRTLVHTVRSGRVSPANVCVRGSVCISAGFDDTVDVVPLTPSKIRAVSAFFFWAPQLLFWYGPHFGNQVLFLANWDFLLTILPILNVEQSSVQFLRGIGPSARQSLPLTVDELAFLPQADEPWAPNGPAVPKDKSLITVLVATSGGRNSSDHVRGRFY